MGYKLSTELKVHWLCVEYPGYGIYNDSLPSEAAIEEDTLTVYEYLTNTIGIDQQDIIWYGYSIGSGPATYLASKQNLWLLILQSPFSSLIDFVNGLKKKIKVNDGFRNIDRIKDVTCPILIIHGRNDNLISFRQGDKLSSQCQGIYEFALKDMTHNDFKVKTDIIDTINSFVEQNYITIYPANTPLEKIQNFLI